MPTERRAAVRVVAEDLRRIFADDLEAVVAYGWRQQPLVPSLALVRRLTLDDLTACAARTAAWHHAGAATPLVLTRDDFARSLDAFPIEYGEILASHDVVFGADPFDGLAIRPDDLRRACEVQAKSHLLHLREDYLEAGAHPRAVESLVLESAPGFATLLRHLARLDGAPSDASADIVRFAAARLGLDARVVADLLSLADAERLTAGDPVKLFPPYLSAVERVCTFVDQWRAR